MSLGGKTTTSNKIDPDLKRAALENLAMAKKIGQLGYVPYTGDTVAGMQPGQIAAIQSGNMGSNAFGLPEMAVPTGANLNPYASYEAALANIPPAQRAFIESMFINPQTGAAPTMNYSTGGSSANRQLGMSGGYSNSRAGMGRPDPNNFVGAGPGPDGRFSSTVNAVGSYLPGGVNTRNPNSVLNQLASAVRNIVSPQKAPTIANKPVARPK
jgi:hypothetical protein